MIDFILSHAWDWFIGSLCFSLVCVVFAIAFASIALLTDAMFWKRK